MQTSTVCTISLLAPAAALALLIAPLLSPASFEGDTTRLLYTLLYTAVTWGTALCSQHRLVVALGAALAATGGALQQMKLEISNEFYVHTFPGVCLVRGASFILQGDGSPLSIQWWLGAVIAFGFMIALVGQARQTLLVEHPQVKHVAHELMHFTLLTMVAIATLQDALSRRSNLRRAAARLLSVRRVIDPACFTTLGLLFATHHHDQFEVGFEFHAVLSKLLLAIAAALLASAIAHTADAASVRATSLRQLVAFLYTLTGVWLIHMGAFLYMHGTPWEKDPFRGLHLLLWHDDHNSQPAASQVVGLYLGLDVVICAAVMIVRVMNASDAAPAVPAYAPTPTNAADGVADDGEIAPLGKHAPQQARKQNGTAEEQYSLVV